MHKLALIDPSSKEGAGLGQQLFQLQVEQLHHDEEFHKEICRLSVHHRINHMALHFAKYAGRFLECDRSGDDRLFKQTSVDTSIIAMVSANIFNVKLADQFAVSEIKRCKNLIELGAANLNAFKMERYDRRAFIDNLVVHSGLLAKTCEAIDHLEGYPFKQEICSQVVKIYKLALIGASGEGIDLLVATRARLNEIKQKSIFYGLGK